MKTHHEQSAKFLCFFLTSQALEIWEFIKNPEWGFSIEDDNKASDAACTAYLNCLSESFRLFKDNKNFGFKGGCERAYFRIWWLLTGQLEDRLAST